MKKALFLVLILTSIWSCKEEKGFRVDGKINGYDNMTVYFDRIKGDGAMEVLSKGKTNGSGSIDLLLPETIDAGIYRLRAGASSIPIIVDGTTKKMKIDADLKTIGSHDYKVSNAPLTEAFQKEMQRISSDNTAKASLLERVKDFDPILGFALLNKVYNNDVNAAMAHKGVLDKMKSTYPKSYLLESYEPQVGQMLNSYYKMMAQRKVSPGQMAPEIALPDLKGNIQKLSDLKGKLVLLDFWASWCGPCRRANPKIVDVYNRYKSKGFTVYSVSLDGAAVRPGQNLSPAALQAQKDRGRERWADAIKKDKLAWNHHVSSLAKWNCPSASEYGVTSIPRAFLIDREGKIIANNVKNDLEALVQANI